jgi:hypothetical protein
VHLSDFYSYRLIGKLTAFLQLQDFRLRNSPASDQFRFRRAAFSQQIKTKVDLVLAKAVALRINARLINISAIYL